MDYGDKGMSKSFGGASIHPTTQSNIPDPTISVGFNLSAEMVARPEGKVSVYHHLVETLKFAVGQRWRLWDPRSHPGIQVRLPGADDVLSHLFPRIQHGGRDRSGMGEGEKFLCSSRQGYPGSGPEGWKGLWGGSYSR